MGEGLGGLLVRARWLIENRAGVFGIGRRTEYSKLCRRLCAKATVDWGINKGKRQIRQ